MSKVLKRAINIEHIIPFVKITTINKCNFTAILNEKIM